MNQSNNQDGPHDRHTAAAVARTLDIFRMVLPPSDLECTTGADNTIGGSATRGDTDAPPPPPPPPLFEWDLFFVGEAVSLPLIRGVRPGTKPGVIGDRREIDIVLSSWSVS